MKTVLRFFMMSFVAVVGFGDVSTFADEGTTASHSGHVRTRFEFTDNSGGTDTKWNEVFLNRARLNVDVMPVDTLKVRIAPYATWLWNGAAVTGFNLKEGWMAWMPTDMLGLYVGRQEIAYGKGRIWGRDDWTQMGNSHDAAKLVVSHDFGHSDFFWIKQQENQFAAEGVLATPPQGDWNIFALYNSFNLEDKTGFLKTVDVYGHVHWQKDVGGVAASDTKLWTFGALADGAMNELDYNAELTIQSGEIAGVDDRSGLAIDAHLGYALMEKHRVGAGITYVNDKFVNEATSSDSHGVRGDADLVNKNNLMAIQVNAMAKLTDEFDVGATGWWFRKADKDKASPFNTSNAALTTALDAGSKAEVAFELDFRAGYSPEDNLRFDAGYAVFLPKGDLDTNNVETVSDVYIQGTLKF